MNKKANIWIYVLAIYVVFQLVWWGVHLIQLTQEISGVNGEVSRRVAMIIGEGCVFFIILLLGLLKIRSSLKKERLINEQQKNFLLAITHELKTPLASTQLNVQTIQKRNLSDEQRNMLLDNIQSDTSRLSVLISNILQVTQLDQSNFVLVKSKFDVVELIQKVQERHQSVFPEADISFQGGNSLIVSADYDSLDSVLSNLVHNACKYGGTNVQVRINLDDSDERFSILVEDDGKGIPKDKMAEIFKRFVRLENEETRSVQGSGIGLYLTKHLVDLHGGTISVDQSELGGAKFKLDFNKDDE